MYTLHWYCRAFLR